MNSLAINYRGLGWSSAVLGLKALVNKYNSLFFFSFRNKGAEGKSGKHFEEASLSKFCNSRSAGS